MFEKDTDQSIKGYKAIQNVSIKKLDDDQS